MKKIAVVVTARPSYSRIRSALSAIRAHPELELQLVVGSSALLARYGRAVDVMRQEGFDVIAEISNVVEGEDLVTMPKTTGLAMMELATVFKNIQPDVVVTIADRYETIATTIAATYMNIPVAHIQGGEITGSIDEKVRHANTKLSDLHLVSCQDAANNVIRMGEHPDSVVVTGCPSIDIANEVKLDSELDFDIFEKYHGVGERPDLSRGFIVVLQHPVTTEYQTAHNDVMLTLEAAHDIGLPVLWFWPNVDAGSDGTSKGIRQFRESGRDENFYFFKNMQPRDFLKVLTHSHCIVGNSSVAVRECSYLGVPAVNIGTRQNKRMRGQNLLDVPHEQQAIREAIQTQIDHGHYEGEAIYGDGTSGQRIADALNEWSPVFTKVLNY